MKEKETVTASVQTEDRSLPCRFVETVSGNAKAPVRRALISLPGPFKGLTLEAPIYRNTDAKGAVSYTVALPGGKGFPSLKAEKQTLIHEGKAVVLNDDDPIGAAILGKWESAILTAMYAYEKSKNPVQTVTF